MPNATCFLADGVVAERLRDELRDVPHRRGGLRGQAGQCLEDVHLVGPDLQFALAARGADVGGQSPGIGDEHFGSARLHERRRHRSSTGDVKRQAWMDEIGFPAVQPDEPLGVANTDRRVTPQCFTGTRQLEGKVDER
jgi:hypothetical protein